MVTADAVSVALFGWGVALMLAWLLEGAEYGHTDEQDDDNEDWVPRTLRDELPKCPECREAAVASVTGEKYQVEVDRDSERVTACYRPETDTVWLHVDLWTAYEIAMAEQFRDAFEDDRDDE